MVKNSEAVRAATARLAKAGVDAPRLAAEILLAHRLKVPRASVIAGSEDELAPFLHEGFDVDVERACGHEPIQYITGRAESYGLELAVRPGVLVPRPCTDGLIQLALERRPARACDVGTGSGNIAVALAKAGVDVVATDVSEAALEIARENADRHGVRIRFVRTDVLSGVDGPFDAIVSNPPYVRPTDPVTPGTRYEPPEALFAGADGLDVIRKIARQAPSRLSESGRILLEFGVNQEETVRGLFPGAEVLPDLDGTPRFARVPCASRS